MIIKCPVCGGSSCEIYDSARDIEYYTSEEVYDFYMCRDCDVIFIHPMPEDRLSEIYPKNYYSFASGKKTIAQSAKSFLDRRMFHSSFSRLDAEELAVLDVGGGNGWLLDEVKKVDKRVSKTMVVDIDNSAEDIARRKGHGYFLGRFEDFETDNRFDVILMLNLIEHVANPLHVLSKARSLLTDNGILIIQTPNFRSLDARLFKGRSWAGYHTPRHFVLFNKKSFLSIARKAGFLVDRFSYIQGAPFWSISLFNELRERRLVNSDKDNPAIYHRIVPFLQIAAAAFDMIRSPFSPLSQMRIELRKD